MRPRIYLGFFLTIEDVPKEYTFIGISLLNDYVFYLLLTIDDKFHEVHLNTFYIRSKIAHIFYTHQNRVNVQGV